jgi:hypothetical protein
MVMFRTDLNLLENEENFKISNQLIFISYTFLKRFVFLGHKVEDCSCILTNY